MAAVVGSALDGAAAVLRLGGATYFIGYATAKPDQGLGLDTAAALDGLAPGGVGEESKRLWHFEIDGGEKELLFELHPPAAARAWRAPSSGKDRASVFRFICFFGFVLLS